MQTLTNAQMGALGGMLAAFGIFTLILLVLTIIAYWKIFTKAQKPGWHSIIPFLNVYDEFDLCWNGFLGIVSSVALFVVYFLTGSSGDISQLSGGMAFVAFALVIVYLVLNVIEKFKLSKAFGHGVGFAIGLIFLPTLFMLILGFGDSKYVGRPD